MAKFDNIETYSQTQKFANVPFHFGASVPIGSDLVDGFTWFEPGAVFPQPWTYNMAEGCWMSGSVVIDWEYNRHNIVQFGRGWLYQTLPFYGVTNNRILFRHLFGTLWNVGTVAHTASMYYQYALDRFLGSAVMESTFNIPEDTIGLTVPTYATSNGVENKPSSTSMKRITQYDLNIWFTGNTWWQRLYYARLGSAASNSGEAIGISLKQIIQFARL